VRAFDQTLSGLESRTHNSEEPYRYLYFNHMNLALKDSLRSGRGTTISPEVSAILVDMHETFKGGAGRTTGGLGVAGEEESTPSRADGDVQGGGVEERAGEGGQRKKKLGLSKATEICIKTVRFTSARCHA
jgi:hypothetical protein